MSTKPEEQLAVEALREAWNAYRDAKLGELHTTAIALEKAARRAGWPGGTGPKGYRPWTRRMLGIMG